MITPIRIVVVSGVIIACGYCLDRYQRRGAAQRATDERSAADRAKAMEACMAGVWSEARPLIADITSDLSGPGETAARTENGRMLELSLTPQAQRRAWAMAKYMAAEGQTSDPEGATSLMLQRAVAPECNWSEGWKPYEDDPRFQQVYESVRRLLQVADYSNKYALPPAGTAGKGAFICPGWVHQAPAPTADLRPGDYVEVLLDAFSPEPEEVGRFTEWAWVQVTSVPASGDAVAGTITLNAPAGEPQHNVRFGKHHGYEVGSSVVVPRRCVFRLNKMS